MLGRWPSQVENLLAFFKELGDCQYVWGLGREQEELETSSFIVTVVVRNLEDTACMGGFVLSIKKSNLQVSRRRIT